MKKKSKLLPPNYSEHQHNLYYLFPYTLVIWGVVLKKIDGVENEWNAILAYVLLQEWSDSHMFGESLMKLVSMSLM